MNNPNNQISNAVNNNNPALIINNNSNVVLNQEKEAEQQESEEKVNKKRNRPRSSLKETSSRVKRISGKRMKNIKVNKRVNLNSPTMNNNGNKLLTNLNNDKV